MTLVELQNILGRNVESIMNAKTGNEIEVAKYNATYVTLIAKQRTALSGFATKSQER